MTTNEVMVDVKLHISALEYSGAHYRYHTIFYEKIEENDLMYYGYTHISVNRNVT